MLCFCLSMVIFGLNERFIFPLFMYSFEVMLMCCEYDEVKSLKCV